MDFKEFIEVVKVDILDYLLDYEIENVKIEEVLKNNGVVCTGLLLCQKGMDITPNIYLEYYYNLLKQGYEMDSILELMSKEYRKATGEYVQSIEIFTEYEEVKPRIFIKLVNYERNKELLNTCPHVRFLNLAVTFRYLVKNDTMGIASAIVSNHDMERWNITEEELYEVAKSNTRNLFSEVLKPLGEMLDFDFDCQDVPMYLLTNRIGINGATMILYTDVLSKLAEQYDSDLYIIPSSIHEVLLVPTNSTYHDGNSLKDMVHEVNQYVVSELDYLSDDIYYYIKDRNQVMLEEVAS